MFFSLIIVFPKLHLCVTHWPMSKNKRHIFKKFLAEVFNKHLDWFLPRTVDSCIGRAHYDKNCVNVAKHLQKVDNLLFILRVPAIQTNSIDQAYFDLVPFDNVGFDFFWMYLISWRKRHVKWERICLFKPCNRV